VHPPVDGPKLIGGSGGNNPAAREKRRAVIELRKHFPDESWGRFVARLRRVNNINVHRTTAKQWCEAGRTTVATHGRLTGPHRYTAEYKEEVVRYIVGHGRQENGDRRESHSIKNAVRWCAQNGVRVSRKTLRRWVHASGFKYKFRTKGVRLQKRHKERRREVCDEEEKKTETEWEVIVFSDSTYVDKTHVPIPANDGCFCLPGETPAPNTFFRHSENVHVYGALTCFGMVGPFFVDRVNARNYLPILRKMLKGAKKIYEQNGYVFDGEELHFTFMQDGASVHTSELIQNFIATQTDYDIWADGAWPPCSPDLNPIENVWSMMQSKVSPLGGEAKTISALKMRIRRFFKQFPAEMCLKLIRSMPKRLQLMREADYETIKY